MTVWKLYESGSYKPRNLEAGARGVEEVNIITELFRRLFSLFDPDA